MGLMVAPNFSQFSARWQCFVGICHYFLDKPTDGETI